MSSDPLYKFGNRVTILHEFIDKHHVGEVIVHDRYSVDNKQHVYYVKFRTDTSELTVSALESELTRSEARSEFNTPVKPSIGD